MTRLEDELRNTFAANVAEVPPIHDVAGTAIARGRVIRRHRRITVGAAFAVVIAMVTSGTLWAGGGFGGQPGQRRTGQLAAAPNADVTSTAPLDLVVGGELRPAGHAPISLPGSGDVYDALRVPEGWLVVRGDKATHQLWLVRDSGEPTLVIDGLPSNFAFSPDGRRIAYQQGSMLTVATVAGGRDLSGQGVQLPGSDRSQGRTGAELVGWAGSYLVIGNRQGIDYDGYDLWDPSQGGYVPTWNHDVVAIYAATPDGRSVVGEVKDARPGTFCTAVLDPAAGLRAGDKACGQPYLSVARHGLSPDGRWVLGEANRAVGVVDTRNGRLTATSVPAEGTWWAGPVWTGRDTFAVAEESHLRYGRVTDPQHPQELPAPSTTERWLVVARPVA
ncbi:hypothetical protein HC031_06530 [Planosporangium thailandense]|uniref:WD40 repeat domain-containing protein n=1 Tax=Planosporangium thailandense TaxID=765197 RepID=A0ABX0XTP5_9ACTN|nr:PD40 domain-containing protein [Planosporangium thailandense]NJC69377.1 hypothetical protein [Planosporangium thailandense]